jgi:hypothetical protein
MTWFDLRGDARLGRCTTEGCGGQPTSRLEAGGVGSDYCSGCRAAIERLHESPQSILLLCRGCGKTMDYERSIDPTIPESVVKIEQGHCDECWDGDFDDETWFDAQGREVASTQ